MSVKTEKLVEQINKLREHIKSAEERGEDPHSASGELNRLLKELNSANHVLNEGVLKG